MHDLLFDNYLDWTAVPPEEFWGLLDDYADEIGLDPERLVEDLSEEGVLEAVAEDYRQAREVGVPGTPALIVNRTPYTGPLEYGVLERTVRLELLKERQYDQYPDTVIDPQRDYLAVLHTALGDISLALDARQTPVAVNSFVFLAREGWFDGNLFYRVVPGQAAFTGDPSGTGLGGPGYLFADEIIPGLRFDRPGVVALDNAGPDTNGSRFFISLAPLPQSDGQYTIFGRVAGGLAILSRFAPRDLEADPGASEGDRLESVTIVEN
jgi:cyclophilin family peptidyl-prolyl cis-trans isomerase